MKFFAKVASISHYVISASLAVLIFPAVRWAKLPTHIAWGLVIRTYWLNIGLKSIFLACIFCLLSLPLNRTLKPLLSRYRTQKLRAPLIAAFAAVELLQWGTFAGCIILVDTLFVLEIVERERRTSVQKFVATLLIASYMFFGNLLVVISNDLIVSIRPWISYDRFFNRLDSQLLFGTDVPALAHAALAKWPAAWIIFLDRAYFQMFLVVGAALLITSWTDRGRGLQFVGACLTANYIALLIFYFWPTYGPFFLNPEHLSRYPGDVISFRFQRAALSGLNAIWSHTSRVLGTGFYIAFPSLHIASPLVALWFLRRWRATATIIAIYSVLLMIAIPLLEWHYVIDLFAGIALACVAICVSTSCYFSKEPSSQLRRRA